MNFLKPFFLAAFVLFFTTSVQAQWTYEQILSTGDTVEVTFPPHDSTFLPNQLLLKFYDGGLDKDSLCYSCSVIMGRSSGGGHGNDPLPLSDYFSDCKSYLFGQEFTLNVILDPLTRGLLAGKGATSITRLTAANPCTDTLSVTRGGDTIRMDHFNWVVVHFNNDTNVISTILALGLARPPLLQLVSPVTFFASTASPNDPEFVASRQASLNLIGMPNAWDRSVGSESIIVSVIDDGVDYERCELGGDIGEGFKVRGGWNYNTNSMSAVKAPATPHSRFGPRSRMRVSQ